MTDTTDTTTDDEKLERINAIFDVLIEVYFRSAEIPFENAYALAVIARAFLENLRSGRDPEKLCEIYNSHPDHVPTLFPADEALEKHIAGLVGLQKMLAGSWAVRDETIMFIGTEGEETTRLKVPYLRLLPREENEPR